MEPITPAKAFELISNKATLESSYYSYLESVIATSAHYSYHYANSILNGRFELGEAAIATSANYSYSYARYILEGRFELGEAAIATSANYSYSYARDVLKGKRVKIIEEAIATSATESYMYAMEVIEGRFMLGEAAIATSATESYMYAMDVIKGRFRLGEAAITKHVVYNIWYKQLIKKWEESHDPKYKIVAIDYMEVVIIHKDIYDLHEHDQNKSIIVYDDDLLVWMYGKFTVDQLKACMDIVRNIDHL